jgi:hypothetical protein
MRLAVTPSRIHQRTIGSRTRTTRPCGSALRLSLEIAHAAVEAAVVEARRQVRLDERRL